MRRFEEKRANVFIHKTLFKSDRERGKKEHLHLLIEIFTLIL